MLNHPLPADNLSRSPAGLHDNDTLPASAKTNEHPGHMLSPPCSKECCSECPVHPYWKDESCLSNMDPDCPTPLQGSSTCTPASSVTVWSQKESASPLKFSGPGRPELVGLGQQPCEWLSSSTSPHRYYHLDRCFKNRMGGNLPRDIHWGPLGCGRGEGAHQCLGVTSSNTSPAGILTTSAPGTKTCSLADRQHHSGGIHKQEGGGTRSPVLTAQALELWAVALDAGVSLTAQHIPGIQNTAADIASRQIETRTEWTLDKKIFQSICQKFYKPEVDLFASRLNHQVPQYVSRYPDPGALAVDAFLQDWSKWTSLIHPPVVLLPRILKKIRADQATALLIAPNWAGQPWFPELLQMHVDLPLLLPQHPSLLSLPFQPAAQHPLCRSLHLAVWPLSGIVTKQQAFQRKLLTSYWRRWQQPPRSVMQAPGKHGFAGVLNGVSVPFQLL